MPNEPRRERPSHPSTVAESYRRRILPTLSVWASPFPEERLTGHGQCWLGKVRAVKPLQDGPGDAVFRDFETHEKAVIVESLAINNLAAHGSLPIRWSNLRHLAKSPSVGRAHASTVRTDIVSVGSFMPFVIHGLE